MVESTLCMKIHLIASLIVVYALFGCNTPSRTGDDLNSNGAANSVALLETYWKIVEINGLPVTNTASDQKEAHIILKKEGNRLQGFGGCNSLMGSYELMEGNRIKFSGVASTMMACPDMFIESELGRAIEMADNYVIKGKFLMLYKAKMAPMVKFEAE